MSEAPRDGRDILVKIPRPERENGGNWAVAYSLEMYSAQTKDWRSGAREYKDGQLLGWFPLPAESKENL